MLFNVVLINNCLNVTLFEIFYELMLKKIRRIFQWQKKNNILYFARLVWNFHVFFLITSTSFRDYFFSLSIFLTLRITYNEIGRREKKKRKEKKGERDDSTKITFSKMGVRIVHVIFMIDDRMQRVIYLVWREVIVRLFHVPRATTGRYDFPVENTVADTSEHVTAWLTWKNDNK